MMLTEKFINAPFIKYLGFVLIVVMHSCMIMNNIKRATCTLYNQRKLKRDLFRIARNLVYMYMGNGKITSQKNVWACTHYGF